VVVRRLAVLALAISVFAVTPAGAQLPGARPPLSPEAAAQVTAWRTTVAAERERQASLPAPRSLAEDLQRRAELDRVARTAMTPIVESSGGEKGWILAAMFDDLIQIDQANTHALKQALPADGWFRFSRDGRAVSEAARLILQHSPDLEFQKQVLRAIEPLAAAGEANADDYAKLYDRLATKESRPQRYATQVRCIDGRKSFGALEAGDIDAARRRIGFSETRADTEARLNVGDPC
jgi:hypothetical protein